MKTISILGCGWLGLPLAKKLKNSYHLKVTTTTNEKFEKLQSLGFEAFLISEKKQDNLEIFLQCDYLIIAVPPSKFEDYKSFINSVLLQSQSIPTIFISSTSVYNNENGVMIEKSSIEKPINKLLYETEQLFDLKKATILRCSGLMGYDRVAGKYFANKKVVDKNSLVNYVHQDDAVRAIEFVLNKKLLGVFNLCSNEHLSKEEIYHFNALKYGFEMPIFENKECRNRIIDGSFITTYGFKYQFEKLKDYK